MDVNKRSVAYNKGTHYYQFKSFLNRHQSSLNNSTLPSRNVLDSRRNKSTVCRSQGVARSHCKKSAQKLLLNRKYIRLPSILNDYPSPRLTDELLWILDNMQRAKIVSESREDAAESGYLYGQVNRKNVLDIQ